MVYARRTMAGRLERAGMEELQESDAARSLRVAGKEKGVLQTGLQSTLNSPAACWKQTVWFLIDLPLLPFCFGLRARPAFSSDQGCLEAVGWGLPAAGVRWNESCSASSLARHDVSHRIPAKRICAATDSFLKPLSHVPKRDALKNEPPPLQEAISVHEWF